MILQNPPCMSPNIHLFTPFTKSSNGLIKKKRSVLPDTYRQNGRLGLRYPMLLAQSLPVLLRVVSAHTRGPWYLLPVSWGRPVHGETVSGPNSVLTASLRLPHPLGIKGWEEWWVNPKLRHGDGTLSHMYTFSLCIGSLMSEVHERPIWSVV